MMPFDPRRIFDVLASCEVDYVVIGGVAVQAHGHPRTTMDVDIMIGLDQANLERAAAALSQLDARIDEVDAAELLDVTDPQSLGLGANLMLTTTAGDLDVFTGVVPGAAPFVELWERSLTITVSSVSVRIVGLDDLISMKRASKRPQDLHDIIALTKIAE